MNRKVKELIPLFAIGIMVIGAIMLLVAMNSTEEGPAKASTKQETKNEGKIKINNEVSEPVAILDENEEVDKGTPIKDDNTKDETNKTEKDETKTGTVTTAGMMNTTSDVSGMKNYIESMVNDFMPATPTSAETTKKETNTSTSLLDTSSVSDTVAQITTTAPQATVSTAPAKKKPVDVAYNNIEKSVTVGNYVVSSTSNNKIISANSSNKTIAISELDCGKISVLTKNNSYIYIFEQGGGLKRFYLSNGKLKLGAKAYVPFETNEIYFSGENLYMVSTQGVLYAYTEKEGTFMQLGFQRETNSIDGITSVSGTRVSVRCGSTSYSYTFDGLSFNR